MFLNLPARHHALACALLVAAAAAQASSPLLERRPALDALLPAEQAFDLLPIEWRDGALRLSWNIAPGYYLYRQRIRVEALAPDATGLLAIRLPAGIDHVDEHFGAVQIYRGLLEASVPTQGTPRAALRVRVSFQGCADAGVCYPPRTVVQTVAAPLPTTRP
ncbi:protein-disulfide reductase DsbD N-terminal domain-containing protein [Solimonas soli]|uniref:protein-disulfide reductase DsbD N-terminal domain-containing protein n=1 Tax=Solimonas soli TaxID=413479 RepID=UPI0004826C2C|nr:protein-disulfide reductase DsbD N-terminal domain-containing protein [Solimonas soli]